MKRPKEAQDKDTQIDMWSEAGSEMDVNVSVGRRSGFGFGFANQRRDSTWPFDRFLSTNNIFIQTSKADTETRRGLWSA